jgi:hypothetical protein
MRHLLKAPISAVVIGITLVSAGLIAAQEVETVPPTPTVEVPKDFDWGLLGLAGLAGLAGLIPKNETHPARRADDATRTGP